MNSLEEFVSVITGGIVTTLGTIYVGRAGNRSTREGQKLQNDLDWRKQLQEEIKELKQNYEEKVKSLETRIEVLESSRMEMLKDLDTLGDFLDELSLFELYGRDDDEHPNPPEAAAQYYDQARWLRLKAMHDARLEKRRREKENSDGTQ